MGVTRGCFTKLIKNGMKNDVFETHGACFHHTHVREHCGDPGEAWFQRVCRHAPPPAPSGCVPPSPFPREPSACHGLLEGCPVVLGQNLPRFGASRGIHLGPESGRGSAMFLSVGPVWWRCHLSRDNGCAAWSSWLGWCWPSVSIAKWLPPLSAVSECLAGRGVETSSSHPHCSFWKAATALNCASPSPGHRQAATVPSSADTPWEGELFSLRALSFAFLISACSGRCPCLVEWGPLGCRRCWCGCSVPHGLPTSAHHGSQEWLSLPRLSEDHPAFQAPRPALGSCWTPAMDSSISPAPLRGEWY